MILERVDNTMSAKHECVLFSESVNVDLQKHNFTFQRLRKPLKDTKIVA